MPHSSRYLACPYRFYFVAVCCVFAASLLPAVTYSQQTANSGQVFVEIANAKLRGQPKHWAPGSHDLAFGTPLTEISRQGGWMKVKTASGQEGFIHESAVTSRKVVLTANRRSTQGDVNIRPDDSDVVLAGKGFSKEVESGFAATRKDLNFAEVDSLDRAQVSDAELAKFIKTGKLRETGEPNG